MRKPFYILCIILLFLLSSCGNGRQAADTGSISFNLERFRPATASRAAAAASDICTDYGITIINVNVSGPSGAEAGSGNWSCSAHTGTVTDVPAGSGYTIEITGTVTGGEIAWGGEKTGVNVMAGETTVAGTITMSYSGSDTVIPAITSNTPPEGETGVPVTSVLTAVFSEKMAASTINDTTFTLSSDAEPLVSGSVEYDAATQKVTFSPSGNLSYLTGYTATLTTDMEDMAGNETGSTYTWSFTTEDVPPPGTLPVAPDGLIAVSGNARNTITWNAVQAATSYNIYWSATSGVTKDTGNRIQSVTTSTYPHTGLTNGTYYYVVTSVNSYGESDESYEIASSAGAIEGAQPAGSVSINSGAATTTSEAVTLSLSSYSARGVSRMCISNTNTGAEPCSSWEPYTTSKSWTLIPGDGPKFVYVWFEDGTGLKNSAPYLDSITLTQ